MSEQPFFRQGQCNETTGFLFSHDCGEPADHVCGQCQKPVCGKHTVDTQGTLRCTTCAKTWMRTAGQNPQGATGGYSDPYPYYGSPYFYTWHHYGPSYDHQYNRHHHHFHDGDEGSLKGREPGREDLEGFENDMGAS